MTEREFNILSFYISSEDHRVDWWDKEEECRREIVDIYSDIDVSNGIYLFEDEQKDRFDVKISDLRKEDFSFYHIAECKIPW